MLGTYRFANGNIYEGEWKDNMIKGKGKYSLIQEYIISVRMLSMQVSLMRINSMEKARMLLTLGTLNYGGDEKYSGDWVNNRFHGKGI